VSGRGRETAASAAQYLLLGGFAAVATGISAQGLTGFARQNMGLTGPWPYLLFLALDGAAGVCAVLMTRRAARAESGLGPRLAVWGLVAASASFNASHAPHRAGAPEAFGLMPVVAAVLFEFTLRELRERSSARTDRKLGALRWLYPAERVRVQRLLGADEHLSAQEATRRVRIEQAAKRLYHLRRALHARDQAAPARPRTLAAGRAGAAERRAHAALTRASFSDPAVAADVLRQVQVLARTAYLARLDYSTAQPAQDAIASLITAGPPPGPQPQAPSPAAQGAPALGLPPTGAVPAAPVPLPGPGTAREEEQSRADDEHGADDPDGEIVAAAAVIVADARRRGEPIGQKALGRRLRDDGYRVANDSLRALMIAACGRLDASPPSALGHPAVFAHQVNGDRTPLAARLPGQEPGPDDVVLPGPA